MVYQKNKDMAREAHVVVWALESWKLMCYQSQKIIIIIIIIINIFVVALIIFLLYQFITFVQSKKKNLSTFVVFPILVILWLSQK